MAEHVLTFMRLCISSLVLQHSQNPKGNEAGKTQCARCWRVRLWTAEPSDDIFQTVGGGAIQEKVPELDGAGAAEQDKSHSNSSTLSDRRLSNSSLCSIEEEHRTVYEMVQRILLSTRGYVNFVNEVFRQVSVCYTVIQLMASLFLLVRFPLL